VGKFQIHRESFESLVDIHSSIITRKNPGYCSVRFPSSPFFSSDSGIRHAAAT
jgi:hypothetical protein